MKQFTYRIQKDCTMHCGPAGRLAELVKRYPDTAATVAMGARSADLSCPMKVATMGMRKGDVLTVSADGPSEAELIDVLHRHFEEVL